MSTSFDGKLVVAISSRALFDLEDSNRVFEELGVEAYYQYQREHEDQRLAPGVAFPLVKKLLALNALPPVRPRVEVILLSRNTADTVQIRVSDVFYARSQPAPTCILAIPNYAKLEVLSMNDSSRSVEIQVLANINCGYRSLEPGLPKALQLISKQKAQAQIRCRHVGEPKAPALPLTDHGPSQRARTPLRSPTVGHGGGRGAGSSP